MVPALIISGALFVGILFGILFGYVQKKKRKLNVFPKALQEPSAEESVAEYKNLTSIDPSEPQYRQESNVVYENLLENPIIVKVLGLICLIIWIIALFVAWNSPSTTYEANIYSAAPLIFWISNALNLILGCIICVYQIAFQDRKHRSDLWIIGFILILLAFSSIFVIWIIRGYAFLGLSVDSLTHLGWIKNIINSGHLEFGNYYPITHVFISQLSEITNIPPIVFTNVVPFLFTLFSILFVYCLANAVLPKKQQTLLVTVAWMAFLSSYWVQLTPNVLANLFFPIAIFILMKCLYSRRIQWKILFTIIIFLMPLFHPLVGFIFAGFIFIMWLYSILFINDNSPLIKNNLRLVFALSVISFLWCVYWTSAFQIWKNLMIDVVANITTGTPTNLFGLMGEIEYASKYYSVITLFLKTYTGQLIIISLAIFCLITLWKRDIWKRDISKQKIKGLILLFSPMPFLAITIIFLYLSSAGFGPTRLMIFLIFLCSLFVGYILYELIRKSKIYDNHHKHSRIRLSYYSSAMISLLLLFLFAIGVLQLYPSRYTLQPNWQITHSEFTGMDWFTQNKIINAETTSFTIDATRWASVFLTQSEYLNQGYRYYGAAKPGYLYIPWHFGYDKEQYLGQFFNNDVYMILSSRDRIIYQKIWPEIAAIRLQKEDFNQVEQDSSISKLYSNGSLDVYLVKSIANPSFENDRFYWAR